MSIDASTPTTEPLPDATVPDFKPCDPEVTFCGPIDGPADPLPGQEDPLPSFWEQDCFLRDGTVLAAGEWTTDMDDSPDGTTEWDIFPCRAVNVATATPGLPVTTQATVMVGPAPTATPITELPATGLGLDIAVVAGVTVALGFLALFGSRRKDDQ